MGSFSYTALNAAFGAYARKNGGLVLKQKFFELTSVRNIATIPTVKDELQLAVPFMADIVQKGNPTAWNPTNNAIDFAPKTLKVRPFKVDLDIIPLEWHNKWLGEMMLAGSRQFDVTPFEQWLMSEIAKNVASSVERIIWHGQYNAAATPANGTDTLQVNDGFLKKIADAITATTLTPVVTGAITALNAVASLEAVWRALPDVLKAPGAKMYMSQTVYEFYNLNYRTLYGGVNYSDNTAFQKRFLELSGSYCQMIPVPALGSSQRVILDPVGIMHIGVDLESDFSRITAQENYRAISLMVDGKVGTQLVAEKIGSTEYLVVNDQA